MSLIPADVEQTTFSTALRGYDMNEVDDFLDRVVASMRRLEEELADAQSREAETGNGEAAEGRDESVVGRALVAAQQAADKILEDAGVEAGQILTEARTAADIFEDERDARWTAAEAEMEQLGERVVAVRAQLALLATEVADRLDEMDFAIGGVVENGADAQSSDATGGDVGEEDSDWADAEEAPQPDAVEGGKAEEEADGDDAEPDDQRI